MKKLYATSLLMLAMSFTVIGCAKTNDTASTQQSTVETQSEEMTETNMENTESSSVAEESKIVTISNPGYDYYNVDNMEQTDATGDLSLKLLSQEKNAITDTEAWFMDNGLTNPQFPYSDEEYQYEVSGDSEYEPYLLMLSNLMTGDTVTLDFSEFQYGTEYKEENAEFIKQRIRYAKVQDGILYVATAHNTYADFCPQTAYITAIDLSDYHVIWKTAPLTCNSYSFTIEGNTIICGYGFTSEDDSIKLVNLKNGTVYDQVAIKSMAEYILLKDDVLYVRTYDENYQFQVVGGQVQSEAGQEELLYEPIIKTLAKEQNYTLIQLPGLQKPVLLTTDDTYEYGDGENTSIFCNAYAYISGQVVSLGEIAGMGTAYPIRYDDAGIYAAGNHNCARLILEEQDGELLQYWENAIEQFDENGNGTYYYQEGIADQELLPDDSKFLELFDAYGKATIVEFPVAK